MLDNSYRETLFEALLRRAVIDDHMDEMASIPSERDLKELYTFSAHHEARMRVLLRQERRRERMKALFVAARRAAIIIALLGTIVFGSLLTNSEVRATVRNVIVEWFDRFTRYSYNEGMSAVEGIEWTFEYLPEGYTESIRIDLGSFIYIAYTDDENNEISLQYALASDISFGVDNEHSTFEILDLGDIEFYVYTAVSTDNPSIVIWLQDGYAMNLTGYIEVEKLINMAKTIIPK
jgi:hypothetical protein